MDSAKTHILGIDPGYIVGGWALLEVVDSVGPIQVLAAGLLEPKDKSKAVAQLPKTMQVEQALRRLVVCAQELRHLLEVEPDFVGVEHRQPFPGRSSGGFKNSWTEGGLAAYWALQGVAVRLIHPSQTRRALVGKKARQKANVKAKKGAGKAEGVEAAIRRFGDCWLEGVTRGKREHVADAVGVALATWKRVQDEQRAAQ